MRPCQRNQPHGLERYPRDPRPSTTRRRNIRKLIYHRDSSYIPYPCQFSFISSIGSLYRWPLALWTINVPAFAHKQTSFTRFSKFHENSLAVDSIDLFVLSSLLMSIRKLTYLGWPVGTFFGFQVDIGPILEIVKPWCFERRVKHPRYQFQGGNSGQLCNFDCGKLHYEQFETWSLSPQYYRSDGVHFLNSPLC